MFNLGVDLDGVLTRHPDHIRWLGDRILMSGGAVHVITGRREHERKITLDQLKALRIRYSKLHMFPGEYTFEKGLINIEDMEAIGIWKAEVCKNFNISLFMDDNIHFYNEVKFPCPVVHI